MARRDIAGGNTEVKTPLWRSFFFVFLILPLTACGSMNYSVDKHDFVSDSTRPKGSRTLGNIYVNLSEKEFAEPYAVEFNRVKENNNKGYAFQAPLYDNNDNTRLHYTVSRTKDYKWFSGLQLRWSF